MVGQSRVLRGLAASGLGALLVVVACGGGNDGDDDDSSAGGGGSILSFSGGNGYGADGNLPAACTPSPDDTGCVGQAYEGENVPLDIFVMFDVSCSMSCPIDGAGCCSANESPPDSRIRPVRAAMEAFLRDPASAGISVGLGFFGDHQTSETSSPEVCTVEAHADAAVEIAALPGNADPLVAAINAEEPQGGTPTHLAIAGACQHVQAWKADHPGRKTVILLATDGYPEAACDANLNRAISAAADCYDNGNGIQTYVLGIDSNNNGGTPSLALMDDVAVAGGTERAYLTDTQDVEGSMITALNAIRADAVIPCELTIPPPPAGETLNTNLINLGICDPNLEPVVTPRVDNAAACGDSNGWYYDNPVTPETIHLCDVTCDTVSVPGSTLFFSVGCQTQVEIP